MGRDWDTYLKNSDVPLATRVGELVNSGIAFANPRTFLILAEDLLGVIKSSKEEAGGTYSESVNKLHKQSTLARARIKGMEAG